jgi:DNA-binding MarR family transcriptional regulator
MPDLQALLKERDVKKFSKKSYRPWDLTGEKSDEIENPKKEQNITENYNQQISNEYQTDTNLDNKQISNEYQTDINLDNKQISNEYQTDINLDNKQISNKYQTDINLDNKLSQNKLDNEHYKINKSNQQNPIESAFSYEEKFIHHLEKEVANLSGKQKMVFNVIVDICSTRNSYETGPLQTSTLAMVAETTIGTVKVIINRLVTKQLIIRHPGKNAKGGYLNLGVTKDILELVKNNKYPSFNSVEFILANRYQKDINSHNSSSILNKTTTTKNEPEFFEFEKIDFEHLTEIGFSKNQLKQLVGKNSPEVIQESINHFSWGMENNPKFKKYQDPLNVLMGVLRKGQAWIEKEYRSPQEIAQEKLLEFKKAEIERKKKLVDDAFKLALSEWEKTLTSEQNEEITKKTAGDLTPYYAKLTNYFKNNIWPSIKGDYIVAE